MSPTTAPAASIPTIVSALTTNATARALAEASELYFRECRIESPQERAQSFALRYQVYCEEMKFLDAGAYPDGLETDAYDGRSWHFGSFNHEGAIVGTVRLVDDRGLGLPMDLHCALFPEEQ